MDEGLWSCETGAGWVGAGSGSRQHTSTRSSSHHRRASSSAVSGCGNGSATALASCRAGELALWHVDGAKTAAAAGAAAALADAAGEPGVEVDAGADADGGGAKAGSVAGGTCTLLVALLEPGRPGDFRAPKQCCGRPSNGCGGVVGCCIDCGGFRAHTNVHSCNRLCASATKCANGLLAEDASLPLSSIGATRGASLSASASARRATASWSPVSAASQMA